MTTSIVSQDLLDLEQPRFKTCSIYPYAFNDNHELVVLMRRKCGDDPNRYTLKDFGVNKAIDSNMEASIFVTAALAFVKKSGGCFT